MDNHPQPIGEAQNSQKEWYKNWWGIIIALIILPIFAVWFIWAKTQWGNAIKVLATIGVVLITFAAVGSNNSSDKNNNPSQPAQETKGDNSTPAPQATATNANNPADQQNQAAQATPPSEEDQIKQLASKQLEGKNNSGKDFLRKIDVVKQEKGGWGVFVDYNADDNLTTDMRKGGIEMKMSDIYTALYTSGKDIRTASVAAWFPLQDKYGNASDGIVYKSMLDKAEADKVNWQTDKASLDLNILPKVWTTTLLFPDFQK